MKKYNIEDMFLQLIAAGLVETSLECGEQVWRLTREVKSDPMSQYRFKQFDSWVGISLLSTNCEQRHNFASKHANKKLAAKHSMQVSNPE